MDVEPAKEALFNEVYDTEHISRILKVPGVVSVWRLKGESAELKLGSELRDIPVATRPSIRPSMRSNLPT